MEPQSHPNEIAAARRDGPGSAEKRALGRWAPESLLESRQASALESREASAPESRDAKTLQPRESSVPKLRALERNTAPGIRALLRRALTVPVFAGGAVFLIALIGAIVLTTLQMRPAAEASNAIEEELLLKGVSGETGRETAAVDGDAPPTASGLASAPLLETEPIFVHVIGEVTHAGVVEVPEGSRVSDVLAAAGGPTDAAVLTAINLARVAADGEQLLVPNAAQLEAGEIEGVGSSAIGENTRAGANGSVNQSVDGVSQVNLNTASVADLETLPRVGPALAQRIIDWREMSGGFTSVEQLMDISGIGAKTFDGLKDHVAV